MPWIEYKCAYCPHVPSLFEFLRILVLSEWSLIYLTLFCFLITYFLGFEANFNPLGCDCFLKFTSECDTSWPLFCPHILHSLFRSGVSYLSSKTKKVSYVSGEEITNPNPIETNSNFNYEKNQRLWVGTLAKNNSYSQEWVYSLLYDQFQSNILVQKIRIFQLVSKMY